MTKHNKNIGLFFGSFNPIHVGHVMIANYMVELEGMDEVWFVVSPQNPFKNRKELIPEDMRLEMVKIAIGNYRNILATAVEFKLPQPSYTIDTLGLLDVSYPTYTFHILMGADNIINLHRWKDADKIIDKYAKLVYPRNGYSLPVDKLPKKTKITNAPIVDISSTMIREWIDAGHDVRAFMPDGVFDYIEEKKLYRG